MRKTIGKSVTDSGYAQSQSDYNFERSNISFKENKPDGVDSNSNGFYYCVRRKEGRTLRLSADCNVSLYPGDLYIHCAFTAIKLGCKIIQYSFKHPVYLL